MQEIEEGNSIELSLGRGGLEDVGGEIVGVKGQEGVDSMKIFEILFVDGLEEGCGRKVKCLSIHIRLLCL